MRDIKFRGKRLDNNEWIYGNIFIRTELGDNGLSGNDFSEIAIDIPTIEKEGAWFIVIPETVGQYTGLKDKNDVEIYEGDIIKGFIPEIARDPERKGIVKWGLYGWIVDFKLPKHERGIGIVGFCSFRNYEVIGKIYDNSELIKSEEEA